jgi:hypothetical protein
MSERCIPCPHTSLESHEDPEKEPANGANRNDEPQHRHGLAFVFEHANGRDNDGDRNCHKLKEPHQGAKDRTSTGAPNGK